MEPLTIPSNASCHGRQSGMALIVTLVVLVLVTLATISVVRSMDTGNVISGNYAFKETARNVSDRGLTTALVDAQNTVAAGDPNAEVPNQYFNIRQAADSRGIPETIDWAEVDNCRGEDGDPCNNRDGIYRIRYIIERQCSENPNRANVQDVIRACDCDIRTFERGGVTVQEVAVRYRAIVRVDGPRNTSGMYEAVFTGPP